MELAGNIKDFSVVEICQFIWISKKTGKLVLSLEQGGKRYDSAIFFVDGTITNTFADEMKGKEAFFFICEAEDGSFRFVSDETSAETNIVTAMDQLLLEASGRVKLFETLRREIPSSNIIFGLSPEFTTFNLEFDKNQWRAIALTDGKKTLGEISKETGQPEFDTMRIFYSLLQVGVVRRMSVKQKVEKKQESGIHKKSFITVIIDYLKKL
jgi:hypothetical protein